MCIYPKLLVALLVILTTDHAWAELVMQTGDEKLEFSPAELTEKTETCRAAQSLRIADSGMALAFCDCIWNGIAAYVPRSEWNQMIRWSIRSDHETHPVGPQTTFLRDVAPTYILIDPMCRLKVGLPPLGGQ